MIKVNGKYFRKFAPVELFTEYIFSLMKEGKMFMMFTDNKQVLVEEEVDEWNKVNGITNDTERTLYHQYGDKGYIVHHSSELTSVFVPIEMLKWNYDNFIKQCEKDVCISMA